ncbi:uncharacterized protein FA14DRAFT_160711 [Meira miltonrushii]|uniref:Uncharacterized protein n=1 Tax=Meira miltonrushii TaxID=1280837 RepID=A0A316VDU1_9BASI|nr:uncharacterized protein FA14DRAFT_160711 [Meira miltonrushii]PWN35660.1 hypothetical protein FA14DRAFT_160711 [Meira miltonrushii]
MSRIGAKKKTSSSSSGSSTGKRKSVTSTKLAGRPTPTKATTQKQSQATKRKTINRKGRDEDVRQNIDAKWRDGNQIESQNRRGNKPTNNKASTRSDLASTIANFDNLMQ